MGVRGRKPTPTHLRLIKGLKVKTTDVHEAKLPPELPEIPAHLSEEAKEEWNRIAQSLYACGLLTAIDRGVLAAYCQAYGRWVQAERAVAHARRTAGEAPAAGLIGTTTNGNVIVNPLVGIANKAMADMARYAVEFGMTPSARSRISAEARAAEDEAAKKYLA